MDIVTTREPIVPTSLDLGIAVHSTYISPSRRVGTLLQYLVCGAVGH
jgi:hypothetical protein